MGSLKLKFLVPLSIYDATLRFLGLLVVETRDICDLNGKAFHYSMIFSLI